MSHFLVLGAGKMGRVLAKDLIESSPQSRVTLVDIGPEHLKKAGEFVASSRLEVLQGDMDDEEQRKSICRDKDVILNALLHRHSLPLLSTAIRSSAHFVDLAGEAPLDRMAHDREAKAGGVTVLSGMGVSPGLTNVLVGRAAHLLDETESALIFCGGNPVHPRPPLSYRIVYAPTAWLISIKGRSDHQPRLVEVGPLTGQPDLFSALFRHGVFFTDGLSSLLHTMKGKFSGL
jgi:lysine 6-dehydrogenase